MMSSNTLIIKSLIIVFRRAVCTSDNQTVDNQAEDMNYHINQYLSNPLIGFLGLESPAQSSSPIPVLCGAAVSPLRPGLVPSGGSRPAEAV